MNQINLVPIEYKKRHKRKWYILFGALGATTVAMVLMILAFILVLEINTAKQEQKRLIKALSTKDMLETRMILNETTMAQDRNSEAVKLLEELELPTHITRQTMDVILGSVPKGLRMNQIVMERINYNIIIDGHAHSITNVAQYIVQLNNTGQFDIVEYSANPNEDSKIEGWIDYNIRIKPKNLMTDEEINAAEDARKAEEAAEEAELETEPKKDAGGEELL